MPNDRVIDLKRLPRQIGSKRLSFAKEDLLFATLGARQQAVNPFALVNDNERRVRLLLDAARRLPSAGQHGDHRHRHRRSAALPGEHRPGAFGGHLRRDAGKGALTH